MKTKDLEYWKNNCEEDYLHTPISVLRYISEMEKALALCEVIKPLNASFKKGDVVLIDGKEKRIVIEEFANGNVELENDKGWTVVGKMRLSLATESV